MSGREITDLKIPFNRQDALAVAREVYNLLCGHCVKLKVAGSLRRGKRTVNDIEFVYIPRFEERDADLFGVEKHKTNLVDKALDHLIGTGVLRKRLTESNQTIWGEKNKFAVHVQSGIPIDFFATTEAGWWNTIVIRTGGKKTNLMLTKRANDMGFSLEAYGIGFHKMDDKSYVIPMKSEDEIWKFLRLPYVPPEMRE